MYVKSFKTHSSCVCHPLTSYRQMQGAIILYFNTATLICLNYFMVIVEHYVFQYTSSRKQLKKNTMHSYSTVYCFHSQTHNEDPPNHSIRKCMSDVVRITDSSIKWKVISELGENWKYMIEVHHQDINISINVIKILMKTILQNCV